MWRLAASLNVLRNQLNAMSPNRSKVSDGTIGNDEHSHHWSDHNPDHGVVHAMDVTSDGAHGIDGQKLADALLASKDDRIKYVISNRRIASGKDGPKPWVWRPYTGKNPHNHHTHLSVTDAGADRTDPWNIDLDVTLKQSVKPTSRPVNPVLALGTKGVDVERMQKALIAHGASIISDSDFGPKTEAALVAFQKAMGLVPDGRCGPYTWDALLG